MTDSPDSILWPHILVGIGAVLASLFFAQLGHFFGYRRGYLRTGYLLGIFLGPLGVVCASLLPMKHHPMVALENELVLGTSDRSDKRWTYASMFAVLGCGFLACGISLLIGRISLQDGALTSLAVGAGAAFLAAIGFYRAEPPLYLLPALPELEEQGMRDLMEWIHIRHTAARILHVSDILRWGVLVAIVGAVVVGLFALSDWFDTDPYVWRRTLPESISLTAVTLGFITYAIWARSAWRVKLREFYQVYWDVFPGDDSRVYTYPEPREMDKRLQWRYERILRHMGHSRDRAMHFAATTEDTVERTRRLFFLKPVAAFAGAVTIFQLLKIWVASHAVEAIASGQKVDWDSIENTAIGLALLWLAGFYYQRWQGRRRRRRYGG